MLSSSEETNVSFQNLQQQQLPLQPPPQQPSQQISLPAASVQNFPVTQPHMMVVGLPSQAVPTLENPQVFVAGNNPFSSAGFISEAPLEGPSSNVPADAPHILTTSASKGYPNQQPPETVDSELPPTALAVGAGLEALPMQVTNVQGPIHLDAFSGCAQGQPFSIIPGASTTQAISATLLSSSTVINPSSLQQHHTQPQNIGSGQSERVDIIQLRMKEWAEQNMVYAASDDRVSLKLNFAVELGA